MSLKKMSKVIFLDIDGTLVDFHQNMTEGTRSALSRAGANGHKLVLCTGRTYSNIYPWLLELPWDGVIASAGAYVRCGEKVISHKTMENEKVKKLIQFLERHQAFTLTQGIYNRYAKSRDGGKIMDFFARQGFNGEKVLNGITLVEQPAVEEALESVMYFDADLAVPVMEEKIRRKFGNYFSVQGASFGYDKIYTGEIYRGGVTKATGMETLLAYWQMRREDSIAIGDGPNDVDMIQYAGTGIVMENGTEELKAMADFVTNSVEEDGVAHAFTRMSLV